VMKASTKVRTRRVSKITETREWGSEERITRKVKNPNVCHTLNLDYFEVLAHYEIATRFLQDDARLCAMIANPVVVVEFTREVVRVNETPLSDALLDGALRDGFVACRTLEAYALALAELTTRRAAAAQASQIGAPTAPQPAATTPSPPPTKEEQAVLDALRDLQLAAIDFNKSDVSPDRALTAIGDHTAIAASDLTNAQRWLFRALVESRFASTAAALVGLATAAASDLTLGYARRIADALPPATGSPTLSSLDGLSAYEKEQAGLAAAINAGHIAAPGDWPWWAGRCREERLYSADDMAIPARASRLADRQAALDAAPDATTAAALTAGDQHASDANQRQDQQSVEDLLETKFPLEQVAAARERWTALKAHLEEHRNYYCFALFQALPPGEQLERLTQGSGQVLRPGMFEPRVVSMNGDKLAVPLNMAAAQGLDAFLENLIAGIGQLAPTTSTVLLPTPGLSIESRLGRCSACEDYLEARRSVELRQLQATALQAEREAERMGVRLAQNPPVLSDPQETLSPVSIRLERVDQVP